jgi:hypothetical protein
MPSFGSGNGADAGELSDRLPICRETSPRSVRRDGRGSLGCLTSCDQPVGRTLVRYLCVSCSPCWSPMTFAFVGDRYSIPLLHLINRRSSRIPARANSHAGARRCGELAFRALQS